jgi:hypothetical protein
MLHRNNKLVWAGVNGHNLDTALGLLADLKETPKVLHKHVLSWGYKYYKVVIGVMVVIPKLKIGNYETKS